MTNVTQNTNTNGVLMKAGRENGCNFFKNQESPDYFPYLFTLAELEVVIFDYVSVKVFYFSPVFIVMVKYLTSNRGTHWRRHKNEDTTSVKFKVNISNS